MGVEGKEVDQLKRKKGKWVDYYKDKPRTGETFERVNSYPQCPYDKYMEMCAKSDGFDVYPLGGYGRHGRNRFCGGIFECNLSNAKQYEEIAGLANYALEFYNKTFNSDLVLVNVAKANAQVVSGGNYFITLRARRPMNKGYSIYQTSLWEPIQQDPIVQVFRRRPKGYPYKLPRSKNTPRIGKTIKKEPKTPKGAFRRFMKKLRKLPELAEMRYSDVTGLASRTWRSISTEEKIRHYHSRSLKYEDIADFIFE